jgi:ribosomal-protein-alanine N-acetyltransferase
VITATAAHAEAMAAIHAAAFPGEPWDAGSFATLLSQPGVSGFIDKRGGVLVLRVVADEAEILTIGVIETRRRLGTDLMQAAIGRAKNLGAAAMYLEVAAGNAAALGLYQSLGFAPAGRRAKYYPNGDDAVILLLRLEAK